MKSCKDCAFYRAKICHAWLIPTKPEDEPCDKFHERIGLNNEETTEKQKA